MRLLISTEMVGHVSTSLRQWLYWHKSKKVECISFFLGNHGNDRCFCERLNSLYRPAPAADIHHCFLCKVDVDDAITIIVIAVIVKIFGGKGRNDELSNISPIKNTAWSLVVLLSSESQWSRESDHTDSYCMGDDCSQDLGFNSSFIIHPRLAQASQKI